MSLDICYAKHGKENFRFIQGVRNYLKSYLYNKQHVKHYGIRYSLFFSYIFVFFRRK